MPDPDLTFARFVVGSRNELAAAAAQAVAETPGAAYNPLLIVGGRGVGKTHLLHALAHHAVALEPDLEVRLETAEAIADRVTTAIVRGSQGPLADLFGGADILLVDELDGLAGMDRTQDELTEFASAALAEGRQLVFTSVSPPADIGGLTHELRRLLEQGTVVDLDPPDQATRNGIALQFAESLGGSLPPDAARALSDFDLRDIRSIQGAVERLLALSAAEGRECTVSDVYRVVPEWAATQPEADEFDSFLGDISREVAAVVETAPWRRRIAEAILRWEGEGIRTTRLDEALQTDTAPDVDSLIESFERDAGRLVRIRAELGPLEGAGLDDPADLERAEALLARTREEAEPGAAPGVDTEDQDGQVDDGPLDPWFLNPDRIILDWPDIEGRLAEGPR